MNLSKKKPNDNDEIVDVEDVIKYLSSLAESFPYLDEYKILVVDFNVKPFIIMDERELKKIHLKMGILT